MNVLVVDDEKEIADLVELYLKNEGIKFLSFIMEQMLYIVLFMKI